MTTGWVIGVLIEQPKNDPPLRHFYAVAQPDRARAEWSAIDKALAAGSVAASPWNGQEPVEAIGPLSAKAVGDLGLTVGEIKALGVRWPRRWVGGGRSLAN